MPEPIALWVAPVSNLAGVARHILDVARVGLPGYRLVVTAPEGPLLEQLRAMGRPVVPLEVDCSVTDTVRALRSTVRRLKPVMVHSHLAKADFLVTMATVGLAVTLVSTEHHIPEDPLTFHGTRAKALSRQAAHNARIRRFAALIAVSESTKRDMLRNWRPTAPITLVRNAVDRIAPASRPPGLRILSLTRLAPEKNLETTLRTFREVVRSHPEARLTLAGEGSEAIRLQHLARELGVSETVSFPGHVDAAEAMADHDVLLQPSKADNLSYTLLDAVNAGMGVVASDIGGNPEILPAHCMAGPDDVAALAALVIDQGLTPQRRPQLPPGIPTVEEMANGIVEVYRRSGRR
ncbi:glycosyltransferase family 4 protein [Yimella sp. cx-573]|nr:glycosyltransferase family 4 protein [Yimella sp. cx-573]